MGRFSCWRSKCIARDIDHILVHQNHHLHVSPGDQIDLPHSRTIYFDLREGRSIIWKRKNRFFSQTTYCRVQTPFATSPVKRIRWVILEKPLALPAKHFRNRWKWTLTVRLISASCPKQFRIRSLEPLVLPWTNFDNCAVDLCAVIIELTCWSHRYMIKSITINGVWWPRASKRRPNPCSILIIPATPILNSWKENDLPTNSVLRLFQFYLHICRTPQDVVHSRQWFVRNRSIEYFFLE